MVSTQLKNISQIGSIGAKIKKVWNHHLVILNSWFPPPLAQLQKCDLLGEKTMPWEKGLEMIPSRSWTAIAPEKLPFHPIGTKVVFQPPFFRGELLNFGGVSLLCPMWWDYLTTFPLVHVDGFHLMYLDLLKVVGQIKKKYSIPNGGFVICHGRIQTNITFSKHKPSVGTFHPYIWRIWKFGKSEDIYPNLGKNGLPKSLELVDSSKVVEVTPQNPCRSSRWKIPSFSWGFRWLGLNFFFGLPPKNANIGQI